MPDPLAMAEIFTNLFPILHSSYATLGLVSVVIIAVAALNHTYLVCSALNFFTNSGTLFFIFKYGKSSPIIPVEAKSKSVIFTTYFTPPRDWDDFKVKDFASAVAISFNP